jgi:hypothetical protein
MIGKGIIARTVEGSKSFFRQPVSYPAGRDRWRRRMEQRDGLYIVRHFIDNAFVDALEGGTFETLNPATNRPIGIVADGTAADVDRAVRAARRAFEEGPCRPPSGPATFAASAISS